MDEATFVSLVRLSEPIIRESKVDILRPLSETILAEIASLPRGVFIVTGLRGSGKTTLLGALYEREKEKIIFLNAEIIARQGVSLLDVLSYAAQRGYTFFLLDEIHALADWEKDIKIFYDGTKGKILLTGSSAIALKARGSELSRRASFYHLGPLSFREYIYFKTGELLPIISLKDIFLKKEELQRRILPFTHFFSPYCQFEALPAALFEKSREVYLNIIDRTVRYDLVSLRELDISYLDTVFRVLKIIATSPPGELSYSGISSSLRIHIRMAKEMVSLLALSGLLYLIPPNGVGKSAVRKEEKILMPLSLRSALCTSYGASIPIGSLREDFFVQHVGKCSYYKTGIERRTPDFVVEDYIFEVGGPTKGFAQLQEKKNAFLVKEGFPVGEKEISLYLFGFLY
ncbi:ATP-binding protein [Candidatus Woesearchaeota archaeon]|nr:ATP-binding protein [Candidatus Woesearchaeota archaeon]